MNNTTTTELTALQSSATQNESEAVRLQKYLARCGVASRRASEQLILEGHISVNGEQVRELGTKVRLYVDTVCCDGAEVVLPPCSVTIMLNKPAGYVTTMEDPQGRPCVSALIPTSSIPGLYHVGRLDRDTTGLLLFSNDGELGHLLAHPKHHVHKTYVAYVQGKPTEAGLEQLRSGIMLDDGLTLPAQVRVLEGEERNKAMSAFAFDEAGASGKELAGKARHGMKGTRERGCSVVEITISEGRKRQVRRMLSAIHCPVIALHRLQLGPLSLGDLPRGCWRILETEELEALRAAAQ